MDPNELDDLEALSRDQLLSSRNYEYWQRPGSSEQDNLVLLNMLGGQTDSYGMEVPESSSYGQQNFNRLVTGDALSRPQQRYINTREAAINARQSNRRPPTFEQQRLEQPKAPVMRMPPATVQGSFNAKHGQAIAFAKALGFGQQIASSPQNAEIAYQAMTAMLRRVPLPLLLSPRRKQQTAMEFQTLLEQFSKPQPISSSSRPPVQPT